MIGILDNTHTHTHVLHATDRADLPNLTNLINCGCSEGLDTCVVQDFYMIIFQYTLRAAEDSSGQDRMGGYTRWPEAYLVTLTDRCSFLCVSGQRGTIAKSMHEEHLCVVALTSMERGTQFFPLASYRLV